MRIEPLGDKIVVKRTEAEETTAGGIVLPDAAREKPQEGKVLSVGAGKCWKTGLARNYKSTKVTGSCSQVTQEPKSK